MELSAPVQVFQAAPKPGARSSAKPRVAWSFRSRSGGRGAAGWSH